MRRPIDGFNPLVTAAAAGAAPGLLAAVILLALEDPPGWPRSYAIFHAIALPVSFWLSHVTWTLSRTALFLTALPLSGAVWAVALISLRRGLRRNATFRRVAVGSALAGTALAMLVWMGGISNAGPYNGVQGLMFLAQIPGMTLLALMGYDTNLYDGTMIGGLYRPGPVTLPLFALANTLLAAGLAAVARFTWRWIRMPMPRRSPVADG